MGARLEWEVRYIRPYISINAVFMAFSRWFQSVCAGFEQWMAGCGYNTGC